MIRSLMASTALLALITTGALAQQQPADQTQQQQPQAQQQQEQGQQPQGVQQTQQQGEVLADDLMGQTVYSGRTEDAESVGDIEDLVLDDQGEVSAVVIGVGGFLGIGQKDVAINYEELEFSQDQDGELRVVVNATQEQLEAAPEFEETDQTRLYGSLSEEERQTARVPQGEQQPQDQQAAQQPEPQDQQAAQQQQDQAVEPPEQQEEMAEQQPDQQAQQDQQQMAQQPDQQAEPDQQMAQQPDQQDQLAQDQQAEPDQQQMAAGDAQETRFLTAAETGDSRATDWIGQPIVTAEDEEVGEVRDLLVEDSGRTEAVLVDLSQIEADKQVAIPFDAIQVEQQDGEEQRLVVDMSRDELAQAPAYQPEQQQAQQPDQQAQQQQDQMAQQPDQQQDQMAEQQPDQQAQQDQMAQDQQAQQPEGTEQQLGAGEILADDLIGETVYSGQAEDAEEIGQISDLVVDEQGEISSAVIGVGGFLGIGEKDVAVDFEQLQFTQDQQGEVRIVAEVTREELETAQEFQASEETQLYGELSQEERSAARMPQQQDQQMAQQPDQQAQPEQQDQEMAARQQEPAATGEAQERQAARAPGVTQQAQGLSADQLMGANVVGANNEEIGEVGDVILSQDGQIRAVVVDVGGFLGIGAKEVAIEFESAQIQRQDGELALLVNATEQQLEDAPEYQETAELQQQGGQQQGQQPAAQQPAGQQQDQQQPAQQ